MASRGVFFSQNYDFTNCVFANNNNNNNNNKSLQFLTEKLGQRHSNLPLILLLIILAALFMNVSITLIFYKDFF